ncbi:hypothetical protein C8J57DRAFT_1164507 [Mycena rebaudengoi]|nr:hypothetical protein C8J57DRAFT_1164507 [Mycena rebaudengoi]
MDAESSAPQRVEELRFDDGSLVIQAGLSLFRIHRTVLAARLPVIQDMLSFPQPTDGETVDGCPLARLPDSAADTRFFLQAIYNSGFFEGHPAPTTFDILATVLRLSNKYGVEYLRRRALVNLSIWCSTTFSAFESRHALRVSGQPSWWHITDSDDSPSESLVLRINLCREVEAIWALPFTFYSLSEYAGRCGIDSNFLSNLSTNDQITFSNGHSAQLNLNIATNDVLRFLHVPAVIPGCVHPSRCSRGRLALTDEMRELRSSRQRVSGRSSGHLAGHL